MVEAWGAYSLMRQADGFANQLLQFCGINAMIETCSMRTQIRWQQEGFWNGSWSRLSWILKEWVGITSLKIERKSETVYMFKAL